MSHYLTHKFIHPLLCLLAIFGLAPLMTTAVFAANAGSSGTVSGGCNSPLGWCIDASRNGAAWVRIPYDSNDSVSLKKLMRDNLPHYKEASNAYSDATVFNCKESGGYVYTLVTPISNVDAFAGPVPMYIAKSIYDGFNGYTVDNVVRGDDVLNIFNSAATNGQINGYTYSDNSTMSWFCGAKEASIETTYQSHTTLTVNGKTVNSGWDGFGSDSLSVSADTERVTVGFGHKIRRTDNQNVSSNVGWIRFDQNSQSDWTNTDPFDYGSNYERTVWAGAGDIAVSAGETLVCYGLYHDSIILMKPDGSARAQNSSGRYSKSTACITISKPTKADPTTSTTMQFIGESTAGKITGAATFYTNLTNASDNRFSVPSGGAKLYFAAEQENPVPNDYQQDGSPYALCQVFNRTYPYGCRNGAPDSIPDDDTYLSAKICAIPAAKESEPNGKTGRVQRRIYNPERPDNDKYETREVTIDLYDYYWHVEAASCSPIAKRPNFRITGSTTFSAGGIKTKSSSKASGTTFGSWSEYLAIAGGEIKGFASGATLRAGSGTSDLKANSPLTIANDSGTLGNSGISADDNFITNIKARFINTDNYDHSRVQVIKLGNGDSLTGDIVNRLDPSKLNIVYAKNINIAPNVTEIKAWLIADDTINTCAGYDKVEAIDVNTCGNSLTINGIAYAQKFKLYRTAGANGSARAGQDNAASAEIINLTTDDYRRAYDYATANAMQPTEVYLQELAPRV